MAKLRMAHPSTHGARKPPGPKKIVTMIQEPDTIYIYKNMQIKMQPFFSNAILVAKK